MVVEILQTDAVWINAKLATFDLTSPASYGAIYDCALIVRQGKIAGLIPMSQLRDVNVPSAIHDVAGKWITPGLIDCHTHLIHAGNRVREWEMRLNGIPYAEISRQGGGILNTVRATREMSEEQLFELAVPRLDALIREGVTTVEIKSGYGLTVDDELKMLRVAKTLRQAYAVDISPTLLAAHAIPPEFAGRSDDYVTCIVERMIPQVAREELAEAVDVFCERIAFTPEQSDRIWHAAKSHGLAVKGHVEQLSNLGGSILLAKHSAWSADHLEYLDQIGVDAMAAANTVAVLLPAAFYFLRETRKPPTAALRQAGVRMAIGTDFNPGTAPLISLRLAMNMAVILFGLSPEEALAGATREAACALGRGDHMGTLEVGKDANFLVWDVEHPAEIVLRLGVNPIQQRVFRGKITNG